MVRTRPRRPTVPPLPHDPWIVATTGQLTTATELWQTGQDLTTALAAVSEAMVTLDERVSAQEATYDGPGSHYDEWLHDVLTGVYYYTLDEIDDITSNSALTAEYEALHQWWLAAYTAKQQSYRARADWHDGFTRVRQRTMEWRDRQRTYREHQTQGDNHE